ncbi:hypothetical protein GCM10011375_21780 [Hymenobacter qilianensis]|uniref:DUF4097 family beta strand repeat protein n=2 Tax=Hymenobacter qilianensis TaxID=1385715 RepID=A0A7H0GVJ8_9BACT|nr:DUF4097 family beta strand repeat-containing protein [Hymenobacter qilianensis]QNP52314.1 DUF4097 family beta strand repeat protein [Hymenobacter qilianensis]GGF66417.1 hypothetical protein GCM10011375_21780 [Hymenobacter qilianensis]
MKNLLAALLLNTLALTAAAQTAPVFTSTCEGKYNSSSSETTKRICETRDLTMPALGGKTLTIDGRQNGGITVRGWSGSEVRIRAVVQAWGNTEAAARQQIPTIRISTANNTLRAEAPGGDTWSVSYEVFVPQQTSLALNTNNGGIRLQDVRGTITFETKNGGVSLAGVGGNVKGRTTNGGLDIQLTGDKWDGTGLDIATTNGGIKWEVPQNYSARLTTSTAVGGLKADLPITKNGMLGREIATTLGKGGAPVKAVTTNGGIKIDRTGK